MRSTHGRSGQSLIESALVVALMSLILFGLLEIARLFMAREVVNYAATVGARAHAVGFNDFMIFKTIRVAAIPAAGKIVTPQVAFTDPNAGLWQTRTPGYLWDFAVGSASPASLQYSQIEQSRIPLYLGAENMAQLDPILDYEDWNNQFFNSYASGGDQVSTSVRQDVQLKFPFHSAFWAADEVREAGDATQDSHYPLYLQ